LTQLLAGDDFEALFTQFAHTAFRLEVRESYAGMPYEVEPLRQFLAGEATVDLDWTKGYRSLVSEHAAAGRRITRVRIVSEPWSDYTRFGVWLAAGTNAAGEDIRYLPRAILRSVTCRTMTTGCSIPAVSMSCTSLRMTI